MDGVVVDVPGAKPGVVRGSNGRRYSYGFSDWKGLGMPSQGDPVSFVATGGQATEVQRRTDTAVTSSWEVELDTVAEPEPAASTLPRQPASEAVRTSGLAVLSLVMGIVGLLFLGSLIAVVCGHVARANIRRSNGQLKGDGLALGGLVLGYLGLLSWLVMVMILSTEGSLVYR